MYKRQYKNRNTLIKFLNFGGHEITYQAWNGIDNQTLQTDRTFNPSGLYYDNDGATQFYDNEVDNYKQDHFQLHWSEIINENLTSFEIYFSSGAIILFILILIQNSNYKSQTRVK